MRSLRKGFILLLAFIFCWFSAGCRANSSNVTESKPSVEILAELIESELSLNDGYYSPSENYFNYYFKSSDGKSIGELSGVSWIIRRSNSQESENEFGIIRASDSDIKQIENACKAYIERQRNAYLEAKASYSPQEYEKYRDASVYTSGDTVIYFILSSSDTRIARSIIEDALKR